MLDLHTCISFYGELVMPRDLCLLPPPKWRLPRLSLYSLSEDQRSISHGPPTVFAAGTADEQSIKSCSTFHQHEFGRDKSASSQECS